MRVVVNEWEVALLFSDGRYEGTLAPGAHRVGALFREVTVKRLARRQWITEANVECASADRFPLRLSLAASCEVTDARLAFDADHLVRARLALAAAAVHAAALAPLEDLVVGREAISNAAAAHVQDKVPGCTLAPVQVTSLVLPPEVRRMFTDVERARREGEASLERARAEHAGLRALANAARLLRGNPELMNLRLLQAVGSFQKPGTLVLGGTALSPVTPAGARPDEEAESP